MADVTRAAEGLPGRAGGVLRPGGTLPLPVVRAGVSAFDHRSIEAKWQRRWAEQGTFRVANPGEPGFDPSRPKLYVLDMFPYPSGEGLHVGHPLGYIATDIYSRYQRMQGRQVLHPMGFDAFGLPAEQYAVETGVHPRITTERNVANFTRQLRAFGLSYDWDRSFATTDPGYYRWTQWIFLRLFHSWFDPEQGKARPIADLVADLESGAPPGRRPALGRPEPGRSGEAYLNGRRLAFIDEVPVNWCPGLGTVLANEEVTREGRSDRGDFPVYRRPLRQWMLRITAYAERLLADLDLVDWPESIKAMQRNWIGRSEGARVLFPVDGSREVIEVFTTRPDTLFGATYMVLAPEHSLVEALVPEAWPPGTPASWTGGAATPRQAVADYQRRASGRSELERQAETKEKTGVFLGRYAVNPVNGARIPVFLADYVLMGYGTGAIMAVPAEDERDWEFAEAFGLAHRPHGAAARGLGRALRRRRAGRSTAGSSTACGWPRPRPRMTAWLEEHGCGAGAVTYKLRDWLFSRQRYWGEPIPILHGPGRGVAPAGRRRVAAAPAGGRGLPAPHRPARGRRAGAGPGPGPRGVEDGGARRRGLPARAEHHAAVGRVLLVLPAVLRPAQRRRPRWGPRRSATGWGSGAWTCTSAGWSTPSSTCCTPASGTRCSSTWATSPRRSRSAACSTRATSWPTPSRTSAASTCPPPRWRRATGSSSYQGRPVTRSFGKMGKSLKNSVNPDEIFAEYGVDTLRLYEMFMGPLDASKPWTTRDIVGVHRFVLRLWRALVDPETGEAPGERGRGRLRVARSDPPHHRRGDRRHGGAALQHRGGPVLRVEQRPGGPGAGAAGGGRGLRAPAGPLRPAPVRGVVGASGARRVGGLRPLARRSTRLWPPRTR